MSAMDKISDFVIGILTEIRLRTWIGPEQGWDLVPPSQLPYFSLLVMRIYTNREMPNFDISYYV